jgi:hypothetical protein
MPSIDPVRPGQPLHADEENKLREIARGASEPHSPGIGMQTGTGGPTWEIHSKTLTRVFELTEDQQYPDAQTPPDDLATLPDVPYAENCKAVWLDQDTNTYGISGSLPETVYFPEVKDFEVTDAPFLTNGERTTATWDAQAGRWHGERPGTASGVGSGSTTVIRCQVNQSTVAITDDTFAVDGASVISPSDGATPTVTTVNNILHFPSVLDNECIAFLDDGTWYGIPEPPMEVVSPVTEVDYTAGATHAFQAKTTDIVAFSKETESSFSTWHPMVSIDPVTSIDYSTANHDFDLKLTQNVYVVEADSEDAAWTTWHATVAETVVTLVGVSGTTLTRTIENVRALESFTANTSGSYHTGTECS